MAKFFNRVKVAITSTGTGSVTCGAALAGFQSLADASVANSDVVRYTIIDGNSYESGTGTVTLSGSTYSISRGPSVSSESNNSAIDVTSSANLFLTMLAQDVKQVLSDLDNVSTTAPAGGQVLSYDTNSASWVPSSPSGGIASVANYAALPASPSATDLAWTQDTKSLYIYDGTEWDKVSTGSQFAPRFTTSPPSEHTLNNAGGTTSFTVVAVDEDSFPIIYDWDAFTGSTVYSPSSLPPQLTNVAISNGTYTFTPSTNTAHQGTITFRTRASDGVATVVGTTTMHLIFSDAVTISSYSTSGAGNIAASSTGLIDATTASAYISSSNLLPTDALKGGKQYFEVKCLSTYSSPSSGHPELWIGIADTTAAHSNSVGYNSSTKNWCFLRGSGQVGRNGGYTKTSSGWTSTSVWASGDPRTNTSVGFDDGDVIMFAYDTTAKRVWIGLNGQWCDALGGDPGTSTGAAGTTYNDLSGVNNANPDNTFCLVIGNQLAVVNVDMQIQTGSGFSRTYNVPTGFEAY